MLSEEQIKKIAEGAASTAASLLSLGRKYTIAVINDPSYIQDEMGGFYWLAGATVVNGVVIIILCLRDDRRK